jgi:hypothetical protein
VQNSKPERFAVLIEFMMNGTPKERKNCQPTWRFFLTPFFWQFGFPTMVQKNIMVE